MPERIQALTEMKTAVETFRARLEASAKPNERGGYTFDLDEIGDTVHAVAAGLGELGNALDDVLAGFAEEPARLATSKGPACQ